MTCVEEWKPMPRLDHLSDEQNDIFLMSKKLIIGHNPNEVLFVDKMPKNKGFFEKFFNLFN